MNYELSLGLVIQRSVFPLVIQRSVATKDLVYIRSRVHPRERTRDSSLRSE